MISLSLEELSECDKVVEKLGLDKERASYFYNSRKLLSDEDVKKVVKEVKFDCIELNYELPPEIAAIKSLKIEKKTQDFNRRANHIYYKYKLP